MTAAIKTFSELAEKMKNSTEKEAAGKKPSTPHKAVITNTISTGSGFARSLVDGADIFILHTHMTSSNLKVGDQIIAHVVPNRLYEAWTPESRYARPTVWFSVWTEKVWEAPIPQPEAVPQEEVVPEKGVAPQEEAVPEAKEKPKTLREMAYEVLGDEIMTAKEVADILGIKTPNAFVALEGLNDMGLIARINVEGGRKSRTSYVYWCKDRKSLTKILAKK